MQYPGRVGGLIQKYCSRNSNLS